MVSSAERQARIRRATRLAVEQRNRLADAAVAELQHNYQQAAEAIAAQLQVAADAHDRIRLEQLQPLLSQLRQQLQVLQQQRDGQLYRRLEQAALLGSQPFQGELPSSQLFAIHHQAVSFIRGFAAADGLQLSERLWRINRATQDAISDHLQFAIIQGESAHQAVARNLDGMAGRAQAGRLGRELRSLMTGNADPVTGKGVVWQAERLFRTEINRAHGEAYMASAFQTEGVAGVRFMLSPNHRVKDVCDTHASADRYGLGPGIYPTRSSCPWPAHPNTLSYVEVVFKDELASSRPKPAPAPPDKAGQAPASTTTAPASPASATPRSLDEMIAAGREHGARLLAQPLDKDYLARLHGQINAVRSTTTPATVRGQGKGAELVRAASLLFPDAWTTAADRLGPLFARAADSRGFQYTTYQPPAMFALPVFGRIRQAVAGSGYIVADNFSTAVHEYTHRLQHALPQLDDYFQHLHQRRTAGEPLRRLKDLTGLNYASDEVTREDHYTNPYQGREYTGEGLSYRGRHGALEVMTMALEDVLGGNPARLQRMVQADREMFDLVMGLLYHYDPH